MLGQFLIITCLNDYYVLIICLYVYSPSGRQGFENPVFCVPQKDETLSGIGFRLTFVFPRARRRFPVPLATISGATCSDLRCHRNS